MMRTFVFTPRRAPVKIVIDTEKTGDEELLIFINQMNNRKTSEGTVSKRNRDDIWLSGAASMLRTNFSRVLPLLELVLESDYIEISEGVDEPQEVTETKNAFNVRGISASSVK